MSIFYLNILINFMQGCGLTTHIKATFDIDLKCFTYQKYCPFINFDLNHYDTQPLTTSRHHPSSPVFCRVDLYRFIACVICCFTHFITLFGFKLQECQQISLSVLSVSLPTIKRLKLKRSRNQIYRRHRRC